MPTAARSVLLCAAVCSGAALLWACCDHGARCHAWVVQGAEVDVGPMLERYSDLLMDRVLAKLMARQNPPP